MAVIGAGPAGLMAAETLARAGAAVTVYDRMPSPGRKFLLAGRGGLNLTHSDELGMLMSRYGAASQNLRPAIEGFPPTALRAWSEGLGQSTFAGTSGRVFPKAMKSSPLLRAWLQRLSSLNVTFRFRQHWLGWSADGGLLFDTPDGRRTASAGATVLALGGASWPRLGSDGQWAMILEGQSVEVSPLKPANCGFVADFPERFFARFEGQPLKGIELRFGGLRVRGEAVVTGSGLEGGAVYALSSKLRDAIGEKGEALLFIDLRPNRTLEALAASIAKANPKQSMANTLRKGAKLSPVAAALVQDAAIERGDALRTLGPEAVAKLIKGVPVRLTAPASIERAISTAGGISFKEVDSNFMLRRKPGTFVAGEMLDWEAPTGGYLLQACFSTGAAAAQSALAWLNREDDTKAP